MHIFVSHKSCFFYRYTREAEWPWNFCFMSLYYFMLLSSHFIVCPVSATEIIVLANLWNSSSSNVFNLDIEMCIIALFLISGWSWLSFFSRLGLLLEEKRLFRIWFCGHHLVSRKIGEEKPKFSMRNFCLPIFAYMSLALTLWELIFQGFQTTEKISRIVIPWGIFQTTARLKNGGLLFCK